MDKLEYVVRSLSRGTNKKYETYVINAIYQKVNNPNLIIETQKEIRLENGYRPLIDFFLPQLNIAIEVDEGYHANEEQQKRDIWREKSINSQIGKPCIGDSIQFERVVAHDATLEGLNQRIDEVVSLIKDKLLKRTTPLVWKSRVEIIEEIKKRGTIEVDDCFDNNVEIINIVYGKNLKGWRKAGYRMLWFPVISDKDEEEHLSNRASWQNFFNSTHSIIYERSIEESTNHNKKEWALNDEKSGSKRIVFVRDRDSFGKPRKRFAGVFKASGWDDNKNAQIWNLKQIEITIPIDENFIKLL